MNAAQNFYQIHIKTAEAFKAQNFEDGDFDVIFEVGGQRLYAHKYMLSSASETFKTMLSNRWRKTEEPIKIEHYSFNDFKEFLTFIYSGECKLTNDNIFNMVDIAEFYGIKVFKEFCEEFILKLKLDLNNICQICEFANKYSLNELKKSVNTFFWKNFSSILKSEFFQNLSKETVKSFVEETHKTSRQEELFEGVYKWAEKRATKNTQNINEAIKEELADILPLIKFQIMEKEFFTEFVVKKSFLFSSDQLNNLLWNRSKVIVKVINENGKVMKGELCCPDIDTVVDAVKSVKNHITLMNYNYGLWFNRQTKPSTPSRIDANEKVEWYLIYDSSGIRGNLAIKIRKSLIDGNYLLAEMFAEDGFELGKSKIDVYTFA